jgi:hypothetical protein
VYDRHFATTAFYILTIQKVLIVGKALGLPKPDYLIIANVGYPTIRHSSTSGRLSLLRNNAPLTRKGHIVSIASSRQGKGNQDKEGP